MVVFLLASLAIGGSERKLVRLMNALHARGRRVGCAYLSPPDTLRNELHREIPVWFLDRHARFSPAALRRIHELLRQVDARVLVAVNIYPTLYAAALKRGGAARGVLTVCLLNTLQSPRRRDRFYRPLYRWALGTMDVVVYGSRQQRESWQRSRLGAEDRSRVIYNGVAVPPVGKRSETSFGIPGSRFVFGTVGRLSPEKNQVALFDLLASLRSAGVDAHLLLVGAGPTRAELEQMVTARRLGDFVTMTGELADVGPAIAAMDVFVLPSRSETFSNAVLEAMMLKRPIVMTATGGASEMIRNGVEGYITPIESFGSGALEALKSLHADGVQRRLMGARAFERAQSLFSFERMVDDYEQLIDGLSSKLDRLRG